MTNTLENAYRIAALKKAAIVMNVLSHSIKDPEAKEETKSLAWAISWAVAELERLEV